MVRKITLKRGDRVILKTNPKESWPEERGVIVDVNCKRRVIMVCIDKRYRDVNDPDGLREVDPRDAALDESQTIIRRRL